MYEDIESQARIAAKTGHNHREDRDMEPAYSRYVHQLRDASHSDLWRSGNRIYAAIQVVSNKRDLLIHYDELRWRTSKRNTLIFDIESDVTTRIFSTPSQQQLHNVVVVAWLKRARMSLSA